MGMRYYGILTGLKLDIERPTPYVGKKPNTSKMFLMPTAKDVTLAEYNAASSDAITGKRPCNSGNRSEGLDKWNAPAAINRM